MQMSNATRLTKVSVESPVDEDISYSRRVNILLPYECNQSNLSLNALIGQNF